VSLESVVHKLIDSVHGGTGNAHTALELHAEVEVPDGKLEGTDEDPPKTTEGE
jgi:hypothetical protein